jgi:HEAT repeats
MSFLPPRITWLAVALIFVAGCGIRSDQTPHPVDQELLSESESPPTAPLGGPATAPAVPSDSQPMPALAGLGSAAQRIQYPGARRRLAIEQWTMEQTTVDTLIRIGGPAVPALVNLLDGPDAGLRSEAVVALARIGPEAQPAVPRLIALVENDPDEAVRKNAVRALGQIGPGAAPAVPVLVEQLREEHGTSDQRGTRPRSIPSTGRSDR